MKITDVYATNQKTIAQLEAKIKEVKLNEEYLTKHQDELDAIIGDAQSIGLLTKPYRKVAQHFLVVEIDTLASAFEIVNRCNLADQVFGKDRGTPTFREYNEAQADGLTEQIGIGGITITYSPSSYAISPNLSACKLTVYHTFENGDILEIWLKLSERPFSVGYQKMHGVYQQSHVEYKIKSGKIQGYGSGSSDRIGDRVQYWLSTDAAKEAIQGYLTPAE